jgi:hypothetical protein
MILHDQIEKIISGYHSLPADFADVDRLINARRLLSTHLFEYAQMVGAQKKLASHAELKRKATYAATKQDLIAKGASAAKADAEATVVVAELMEDEYMADAELVAMRLIYEAAKDVLDTLNQHIANLRFERAHINNSQA